MDNRKVEEINPGQLALEDALVRVAMGADPRWVKAARDAVSYVASRKPEVTADDVWDVLAAIDVDTPQPKMMGNIMKDAAREGFITRTDRTVKTRRPSRNVGDVRVWRSLIYKGDPND
jgi:hypothetical protein